jgi:hypothetical protein
MPKTVEQFLSYVITEGLADSQFDTNRKHHGNTKLKLEDAPGKVAQTKYKGPVKKIPSVKESGGHWKLGYDDPDRGNPEFDQTPKRKVPKGNPTRDEYGNKIKKVDHDEPDMYGGKSPAEWFKKYENDKAEHGSHYARKANEDFSLKPKNRKDELARTVGQSSHFPDTLSKKLSKYSKLKSMGVVDREHHYDMDPDGHGTLKPEFSGPEYRGKKGKIGFQKTKPRIKEGFFGDVKDTTKKWAKKAGEKIGDKVDQEKFVFRAANIYPGLSRGTARKFYKKHKVQLHALGKKMNDAVIDD